MKKIISVIMSAVILLSVFSGFSITVSAAAPYVTHTAPKTLKIGQAMPSFDITYHNLPANTKIIVNFNTVGYTDAFNDMGKTYFRLNYYHVGGMGDGGDEGITDKNGQFRLQFNLVPSPSKDAYYIATRAGTRQIQPKYQLWDGDYDNNKNPWVNVGGPIKLTIEEPVITHNAPKSVKTGQSITFTTALTNTALTSMPISKYTSLDNTELPENDNYLIINPVYYIPVITVIQGKELIKQSDQDYSQTQKSSETITFNKAGTVKLKITYKKYILVQTLYNEYFDIIEDGSKNPEKIVTVNVTDPNAPVTPTKPNESPTAPNRKPTDSSETVTSASPSSPDESTTKSDKPPVIIENEDTGIKITAPQNLLPDGTALKADIIDVGEQFSKATDALKAIAEKAVIYDLSLEKDGNKVTFDGKVAVSLPVPNGYEKSRLAVFYISDDGEKTEIPCTVNGDNVTFETDHFSVYALAEKTEEAAAADTSDTAESTDAAKTPDAPMQKKSKTALYVGLAVCAVAVLAGAGVAVWYFKFRKKSDETK